LHLASGAPGDTNILAQFLSHITGQNFVRINITDDNVQTNEGSADSPEHQSNQSISRNAHPIPSVGISSSPKIELPSSVDEMKSDDESYQTCSSGHNVVHSALFDSADSARFPQGDISPYVVNDPKFRLSWTMMPMVSEDFSNFVLVFTSVPVLVASLSEMQLHHERTESNMLT
jgi:hypothetical protein